MSKKRKSGGAFGRAQSELENMRHKDLKRACVVRGLSFEEVINSTIPGLSNWFINNYANGQSPSLLNEYDAWIKQQLLDRNYKEGDPILSPSLRLGYFGEVNPETGETIIKRPKGIKKPKAPKREREETFGIFTGTKKALTYQCQKEGKTLKETLDIVKAQYKEAVDKSIKIWFNRAKKQKID